MAKILKLLLLLALVQSRSMLSLQKVHSKSELVETLGKAKDSKKAVVVKFVMQGCGACSMIKEAIEEMQKNNPDVIFVEAEIGEVKDLAQEHNINAVPTFLFYKSGESKPHDKLVGANKPAIEEKVKALAEPKKGKAPMKAKEEKPEVKKAPKRMAKQSEKHEIVQLHGKEELNSLLNKAKTEHKTVVVKAHMTGCGACSMIKPFFEDLHNQHSGKVIFAEAELGQNGDVMKEYEIMAFPTFLFFKEGESSPSEKIRGANKEALESKVKEVAGKPAVKKQPRKKAQKEVVKEVAPKKDVAQKRIVKKAPENKPVAIKNQRPKRTTKKYVEEQQVGKGCITQTCNSCEGCNTCQK